MSPGGSAEQGWGLHAEQSCSVVETSTGVQGAWDSWKPWGRGGSDPQKELQNAHKSPWPLMCTCTGWNSTKSGQEQLGVGGQMVPFFQLFPGLRPQPSSLYGLHIQPSQSNSCPWLHPCVGNLQNCWTWPLNIYRTLINQGHQVLLIPPPKVINLSYSPNFHYPQLSSGPHFTSASLR